MNRKFLLLFFLSIFSIALYATPKDLQVSTYVSNKNPIGNLSDFSNSYVGLGTAVDYILPNFPYIGFTGRVEAESVLSKNPKFSNWWGFTFTGGLLTNFEINDYVTINPEIAYGVILNTLNIEGVTNTFYDQIMQVSLGLRLSPSTMADRRMSFELAPVYTLAFEKNTTVNYLGLRAGVNYLFK